MKAFFKSILTAASLAIFAGSASAAVYTYDLLDNPDGWLDKNFDYNYGLRLDEYKTPSSYFTLSFSTGQAKLQYDDMNGIARISGKMIRSFANDGFGETWKVFYEMSGVTNTGIGEFTDRAGNGSGYITNGTLTYALGAAARNNGDYFIFGEDARGGSDGLPAGEGWVGKVGGSNDFLFLAELNNVGTGPLPPVPLPATAWMLIAAVGGIGAVARKKKRS